MRRVGTGLVVGMVVWVACAKPAPIDYGDSAGESSGSGESGSVSDGAGVCGDGVLDEGETCDDGNDDDLDACHDDCTLPGRTLWRTEFEGKLVTDIAAAPDRVYVSGGPGGSDNDDWLGAVSLDGEIIEYEPYDQTLITGLFMVSDQRLLWGRAAGKYYAVPLEICVRDIGKTEQCAEPTWEGKVENMAPIVHGFGRVGTVDGYLGEAHVRELGSEGEITGETIISMPEFPEGGFVHAFLPIGHVLVYSDGETGKLLWIDEDGVGGVPAEIGPMDYVGFHPMTVAADGAVALADVDPMGEGARAVAVFDPDGTVRWMLPIEPEHWVRDLIFSDDGDLFVLENLDGPQDALTRYTPDGEPRWTRVWPGDGLSMMEWGPDGTLYLGGAGWESGPDGPAVLRAVRP